MIKFQDVPYMRLNMDRFEQKFRSQLEEFKHAKSFGSCLLCVTWSGPDQR